MKTVIIEDEKLAADRLEELIQDIDPDVEILAKLESIAESVQWLKINKPDLIFMDIKLSDGLSFSIFEHIQVDVPVIFTTAYDQYAIKAFQINSVDYLLKPVRKEELRKSLQKYRKLRSLFQSDLSQLLNALQNKTNSYKKRFVIQYGERIFKVECKDIAYFYAMEKSVFLTTFQKQNYTIDYTLTQLEELLDSDDFFRINRKMIIHYDAIQNMYAFSRSRTKIDLNPPNPKNVDALVSVERAQRFRKWIDK